MRVLQCDRHPFGVHPAGNALLHQEQGDELLAPDLSVLDRGRGLGDFAVLSDALVLRLLSELGARELLQLQATSRVFYIFVCEQELWRSLVLREFSTAEIHLTREGSWKDAFREAWTVRYERWLATHECDLQKATLSWENVVFFSDVLFHNFRCARAEIPRWWWTSKKPVREEDSDSLSEDRFRSEYAQANRPVLLRGGCKSWAALSKWMVNDARYLKEVCGDSTAFSAGGFSFTMSDYLDYAKNVADDQPMYLFCKDFATNAPDLLRDIDPIPRVFALDDYFALLGELNRPDYRWLIIGPERSGSTFHKDPNGTSAWNAVIHGKKKWVFFPPHISPPGIHPSEDESTVMGPVSIVEWFYNFFDQARQSEYMLECVAGPGDVVFVPHGWWHAVLNLDLSVAITQNFVNQENLSAVLRFLRGKAGLISGCSPPAAETLADRFESVMREKHPDIMRGHSSPSRKRSRGLWESLHEQEKDFSFSFGEQSPANDN